MIKNVFLLFFLQFLIIFHIKIIFLFKMTKIICLQNILTHIQNNFLMF